MNTFNIPSVDHLIEGIHYRVVDWSFAESREIDRGLQTNMPGRGAPSTFAEECGPGEKMIFGMCRSAKASPKDDKDFDSSKKTKQETEGEAEAKKQGSEFKNNKMIKDIKSGKKLGWAMKDGKPVLVEWGSVAGEKKVGPKQSTAKPKTGRGGGAAASAKPKEQPKPQAPKPEEEEDEGPAPGELLREEERRGVNYSEGVFDFKVCQKPDGRHYGIPDQDQCQKPNKEVKTAPGKGILGLFPGKRINYETALKQGQQKTSTKKVIQEFESKWNRNPKIEQNLRENLAGYSQGVVNLGVKSARSGEWGKMASLNNLLAAFNIISDGDFRRNAAQMDKEARAGGSPSEFLNKMRASVLAEKKPLAEIALKRGLKAMETGTPAAIWDESAKTWRVNPEFKKTPEKSTRKATPSPIQKPRKQWSKQETIDQYKAFLRMAAANGQSGMSATDSAYRMLAAAKFDPDMMSNSDRMNARREVLGR
jgi:hypothetical protein